MHMAADAPTPGNPWWVYVGGFVVTMLVGYTAARGPVWAEKVKNRFSNQAKEIQPTAAENTATGETILREWLKETRRERDRALGDVERLEKRIKQLEAELYRLGWDGRTA